VIVDNHWGESMKKVVLAGLIAAASFSSAAYAQPYYGPGQGYYRGGTAAVPSGYRAPAVQRAQQPSPAVLLKDGMEKMLTFLRRSPRPGANEIVGFLDSEVAPFFDFGYMARAAAGPVYREMDAAQRSRLEARLKEEFLGTLAMRLSEFNQQQVRYLPPRRVRGDRVTLSVAVDNAGPYPAKIDFRMQRTADGWKVVDVAANGSSARAYYRNYFRRAVARGPAGPGGYGYR
jgi:phospholipid transport system substrate-binding protein